MNKKYCSSFSDYLNEANTKKAQGLLEYVNIRSNEGVELGAHDAIVSHDVDELANMASEIGKDENWLNDIVSREISDLATDRKEGLLPKYKAAKEAGNAEEAEKIKKEMAILTQVIMKKEAELQKELMDLDPEEEDSINGIDKLTNDDESDEHAEDSINDADLAGSAFGKVDPKDEKVEDEDPIEFEKN